MYEDFRKGRAERRGLAGHDQFFMLIEPERSAYDKTGANGKTILENAKEFSDVAIVVISRLGGENNDLPYFNLKHHEANTPIPTPCRATIRELISTFPPRKKICLKCAAKTSAK